MRTKDLPMQPPPKSRANSMPNGMSRQVRPGFRSAAAIIGSTVIVLGAWLLTSCGDGAVAAENANPEIVFDGTTCTYDGPATIEQGGIEFTFINESAISMEAAALLYEDPADYRAALDAFPVGTDADFPDIEVPPSFTVGFSMQNVAPEQRVSTLTLLDIGEHMLWCAETQFGADDPDHVWAAATIEIVP